MRSGFLTRAAATAVVIALLTAGCSGSQEGAETTAAATPSRAVQSPATGSSAPGPVPTSGPAWSRAATYTPTARPGVRPRGLDLRGVDDRDPAAVAEAFVRTVSTWDTRIDQNPADAGARAVRYAGERLREQLLAPQAGSSAGRFLASREEGRGYAAVSAVTPIEGDAPATQGDSAFYGFEVTTRALDGTGKRDVLPEESLIYNLTLTRRPDGRWVVTGQELG